MYVWLVGFYMTETPPHVLQLVDLYKLHIQNTDVPPSYPLLLQLRLMLGLPHDEAEQIEAEVLREAQAFSI